MILQQLLVEQDPSGWRMLVGCILLNQTSRQQVDDVYPKLFEMWPNAPALRFASHPHLFDVIRPLGLQNRRAITLTSFSTWWATRSPAVEEDSMLEMDPPGIGEYARDSWVIFKLGLVPGWEVRDKELRKHLGLSPP
jgi:endonuclease III